MKSFHKLLGQEGERLAEEYLRRMGYVFVAKNYTCRLGELDLIFLDGQDLVFVEVKTMTEKTTQAYGRPSEKVDRNKRRHITLAAAYFLGRHPTLSDSYPRFDVLEVTLTATRPLFSHLKNAFPAEDGFTRKKLF